MQFLNFQCRISNFVFDSKISLSQNSISQSCKFLKFQFLPNLVEIVKNEDGAIQTAIMASDIIIYSIAEGEFTQEAQTTLDFLQQEIFKKKQI